LAARAAAEDELLDELDELEELLEELLEEVLGEGEPQLATHLPGPTGGTTKSALTGKGANANAAEREAAAIRDCCVEHLRAIERAPFSGQKEVTARRCRLPPFGP